MSTEIQLNQANEDLGKGFMMLLQALSGIRGLTDIDANSKNEQDLLRSVLEVMTQNLDFERCSVFLQNGNEELYCVAGYVWEDRVSRNPVPHRESHLFKVGEGIIGRVAETRLTYHCRNCRQDRNYLSIIDANNDKNAGSLICAPIVSGDNFFGVINVSHPDADFFHPWQEHVLGIHANILAFMICNHRLVKDMETQVKNRTRELQKSLHETEILKTKYQALSIVDDLTRINNRRYFFKEVPTALARAMRYNESLSLLFIDIDHFKSVNDTHGHEQGDEVLKDVAAVLAKESRKEDILARMGGEEFAIAVPNTDSDGVQLLARRIKEAVANLEWEIDGKSFGITLSIGISTIKPPSKVGEIPMDRISEIVHVLVREADQALYHCKNVGRDKITFFRDLKTSL